MELYWVETTHIRLLLVWIMYNVKKSRRKTFRLHFIGFDQISILPMRVIYPKLGTTLCGGSLLARKPCISQRRAGCVMHRPSPVRPPLSKWSSTHRTSFSQSYDPSTLEFSFIGWRLVFSLLYSVAILFQCAYRLSPSFDSSSLLLSLSLSMPLSVSIPFTLNISISLWLWLLSPPSFFLFSLTILLHYSCFNNARILPICTTNIHSVFIYPVKFYSLRQKPSRRNSMSVFEWNVYVFEYCEHICFEFCHASLLVNLY